MNKQTKQKPDYGNWVSNRILTITSVISLVFTVLGFVSPFFIIGAVFFIICVVYFIYARYKFSPEGGNLQARIRDLVLDHLDWDGNGEALDIGCGNAPLAIAAAKKYKDAKIVGLDNWSGAWDYSQKVCEENATIEGVSGRITFQKASASDLPYKDGRFDAVMSNFVFHEVTDTKDKRELVKQALRVVKKGGVFAFQDLFLVDKIYGEMDEFLAVIKNWGVQRVDLIKTNDLDFVPNALKLPFMVGEIGIIYGKK